MEDLRERVRSVEEKLDLLAASLNTRFDGVDAAFVEQRQYTEFAFEQHKTAMNAGFARLEARMDAGDARLEAKMGAGFARLDAADARLEAKMDAGFALLKDFIGEQRQLNDLFRRRLNIRDRGRS